MSELTPEERKAARRKRLARPTDWANEALVDDNQKLQLPRDVVRSVDAPLTMAFRLVADGMASMKPYEDCDANEVRMRAIWHALHYVQRRWSGWDKLPDDFFEDAINWEQKTMDFQNAANEREKDA